jgi:predicted RNase H-like HicB family nuclease
MTYTYAATITEQDGGWFVSFPDFPGAYSFGSTMQEACRGAAESLRLTIAEHIDGGLPIPESSIEAKPEAVFCVEVSDYYIARTSCMTVTEAAAELGVSPSRVSQLLSRGQLEARELDGQRLVTIESINRRKANPPAPHRPKRQAPLGYRVAGDGTLEPDPETAPKVREALERYVRDGDNAYSGEQTP